MRDSIILLTGGTGSFGQGFVRLLMGDQNVRMVRVFSRDEHKHRSMRDSLKRDLGAAVEQRVSFFIGDVRDYGRLKRAMDGATHVVHAAALKQAPLGETEASEFIKTNIAGTENVVEVAKEEGVEKALLISSDKAVEPINLYGATKMCAERVFLNADLMRGTSKTRFSCTRYGNVVGTNGSVIPAWLALPDNEPTPVTDIHSTRFWITLQDANVFVYHALSRMQGGEVFIPQMKAVSILTLAKAIRPNSEIRIVGLRPGDKRHEVISINGNETRLSSDKAELLSEGEIRAALGLPAHPPAGEGHLGANVGSDSKREPDPIQAS